MICIFVVLLTGLCRTRMKSFATDVICFFIHYWYCTQNPVVKFDPAASDLDRCNSIGYSIVEQSSSTIV